MKNHSFYFNLFKHPMKKVLLENYGQEYAREIMKNSKITYRKLMVNQTYN